MDRRAILKMDISCHLGVPLYGASFEESPDVEYMSFELIRNVDRSSYTIV